MKRKVIPILCALFLSVAAGNSAYALTKDDLKKSLASITFSTKSGEKSFTKTQLDRINKFLDECGDLTEKQYEEMLMAVGNLQALVNRFTDQENLSVQEMNKDENVISQVKTIIENLKKSIPGLTVALDDGCAFCGTVKLGKATLTVDLKEVNNVENRSSGNKTTKSTTSSNSKNTIKTTGAGMDLSVLSVAATASLLSIAAGALVARKKRLFEGK